VTARAPTEIAVVIPAYNRAATIADTLNSLTRQSYAGWRAIVVDDGSSDGTDRIVEEGAGVDARIDLLRLARNGGVSAARNRALSAVHEPWVCFLDADDWLADTALERLLGRATEGACDAVHGGAARICADGTRVRMPRAPSTRDLFGPFARAPALPIHSCLLRTELVVGTGGFDEALVTCEDWDLWQRLSRDGCRWAAVADEVALYRLRIGSASQRADQMLADGLTVIDRGYRGAPRTGFAASERERLLARTYLACSAGGMAIWG
jgi:glycosyltransferase involved in cell wall biosynthesis